MKLIQALLTENAFANLKNKFKEARAQYIGGGSHGVVYYAPNPIPEIGYEPTEGYLVKVTEDEIEMEAMMKAQGKNFAHLANVGKVVENEKGGWYQVENLEPVTPEISKEIKANVRKIDEFFQEGDKNLLSDLSPELKLTFIGARKEMVQAGIDPEDVDMYGDDNNVMMTSTGRVKLIDY